MVLYKGALRVHRPQCPALIGGNGGSGVHSIKDLWLRCISFNYCYSAILYRYKVSFLIYISKAVAEDIVLEAPFTNVPREMFKCIS